jgi:ATP adenylyltransferase
MHNPHCQFCQMLALMEKHPCWIASFDSSSAFVYPDQSYPGRVVVIFKDHAEDVLDLAPSDSSQLYAEMLALAKSVRTVIRPVRLNYALLGNRIPHVHWHIIPRYVDDHCPGEAPWPHPKIYASDEECLKLAAKLRDTLVP